VRHTDLQKEKLRGTNDQPIHNPQRRDSGNKQMIESSVGQPAIYKLPLRERMPEKNMAIVDSSLCPQYISHDESKSIYLQLSFAILHAY